MFPLPGLTRSHPPVEMAVAVNKAIAPLQPSVTSCAGGALPPAEAAKVSAACANDRLLVIGAGPAAAGVTTRFTGATTFPAQAAGVTIEIKPEYDPGFSPPASTDTTIVPGVLPLDGLALSQEFELETEKAYTSDPQAIGTDWAGGGAAPACAEKESVFGAAVTGAGGAAVTTSVTGIAWDRLHAPAPVSVMIPE